MPGKITYSRRGPRKGSRSIYKPQGARRVSRRRIYRYIPKMMGGATNDAVNPTATVNPTARAAALNQPELKNGVNALDGEGNPITTADTTKTEKSIFGEIADAGTGTFEAAKRSFNDVAVGEGSQELGLKTEDKSVAPPATSTTEPTATGLPAPSVPPVPPVPVAETMPEQEKPQQETLEQEILEQETPEQETPEQEPETTKKPDESPGFLESAKRAIFGQNEEEKTEEPPSALTEPVDMLSPEEAEETASPITTTNVEIYEAKIEGLIEQINLEKEIVATKDQVIETQQKLIDALQGNQMAGSNPTPEFEPEPNSMETSPTSEFASEPNSMETSPTSGFASEPNSIETSPTSEFTSEPNSMETSPTSEFASEPSPTPVFASEPSQISQNELPQQEQPFVQNENELPQQEQPLPNQFQNKITGGKSRRIRRTIRKSKRRPKYSYYYG